MSCTLLVDSVPLPFQNSIALCSMLTILEFNRTRAKRTFSTVYGFVYIVSRIFASKPRLANHIFYSSPFSTQRNWLFSKCRWYYSSTCVYKNVDFGSIRNRAGPILWKSDIPIVNARNNRSRNRAGGRGDRRVYTSDELTRRYKPYRVVVWHDHFLFFDR